MTYPPSGRDYGLDNLFAVAGVARGDIGMVAIGIPTSLPIVIVGSGDLATLMSRYPPILTAASWWLARRQPRGGGA